MGIISPLGQGVEATVAALAANFRGLRPLRLFPLLHARPLPAGEVVLPLASGPLPRCHQLAWLAAGEALAGQEPPDAVVIGVTTGGILTTEENLRQGLSDPAAYRYHRLSSVAEEVARRCRCPGPALTISTACSSGSAAIKLALELIRRGEAKRVLAGGVDSLCRLTYFGFHSLQLVDPEGARPLAKGRQGMSVAEGAAMLLLSAGEAEGALAELLGGGLSCDAYHPAAPHPQGHGAQRAMAAALADAGLDAAEIDYINLHGTGTSDNDQAEARAILALFPRPPLLSSTKGATGHTLGAAGAIEAVVAAIAVSRGLAPANTGGGEPDPALSLTPLAAPLLRSLQTVLSNSLGFGGNNAALVIAAPGRAGRAGVARPGKQPLAIIAHSCLTGAGGDAPAMARLAGGEVVAGLCPAAELAGNLPPRLLRRLKRLPRLALALAEAVRPASATPNAVFMGTGWGALSESHDFLERLFASEEQFPSPTDFVGSVHNAPASQIAIHLQATGPNITTSGGDYSFEQALLAASLLAPEGEEPFLLLAADEYHPVFSPLFAPGSQALPADGGGAFCLHRNPGAGESTIAGLSYRRDTGDGEAVAELLRELGGAAAVTGGYELIFAGLPAASRVRAGEQLEQFLALSGWRGPVLDYRRLTGEFASASAVAAALAVHRRQRVLILGFGEYLTAMAVIAR